MSDMFNECLCGKRPQIYETFGQLGVGCFNEDCALKPDTWIRAGRVYDVRKLAKFWNRMVKDNRVKK